MSCLVLFMHRMACALIFALLKAGSSIAARMAMMAITTSSSIRVKPSFSLGPEKQLARNPVNEDFSDFIVFPLVEGIWRPNTGKPYHRPGLFGNHFLYRTVGKIVIHFHDRPGLGP